MEQDIKTNTSQGRFQVIYTSPEILLASKEWSDVFQSPVLRQHLVGVIIDEAHCIKKWYYNYNTLYILNMFHQVYYLFYTI